jgi:hypothetical protein
MSGNDQGNPLNFIYVWDATSLLTNGIPTPDAQGRFPNKQNLPNAAMPIWEVTAPASDNPPWPNNQGAIANATGAATGRGAIPVKFTAQPTPDSQGRFPNDPTNVNSAIPVYLVATVPGATPPYPNSQEADGGATPVYVVS